MWRASRSWKWKAPQKLKGGFALYGTSTSSLGSVTLRQNIVERIVYGDVHIDGQRYGLSML